MHRGGRLATIQRADAEVIWIKVAKKGGGAAIIQRAEVEVVVIKVTQGGEDTRQYRERVYRL